MEKLLINALSRPPARVAIVTAALCLGCTDAVQLPVTYRVSGEVTLNGSPVENAIISFVPTENSSENLAVQSVTNGQGKFDASSLFEQGRVRQAGILPGKYAVEITKLKLPTTVDVKPTNVMPERYASVKTSKLSVIVSAKEANEFRFALRK